MFEGRVREYFPTLKRQLEQLDGTEGCSYIVDIDLPYYGKRRVEIFFGRRASRETPIILADGPTDSPHRFPSFGRRHLCVWYRDDPRDQRWTFDEGLLPLLGHIRLHLLREAWWRETDDWPGLEVPHSNAAAKEEAAI